MSDPRIDIVDKRLSSIDRIFAFASGKGGVGKSSCSSLAALLLAEEGKKTGLLDLDFQGASDHLLLGVTPSFPEEESGLLPLTPYPGLNFMSVTCFTGEKDLPLRGGAVTDAILELFAVTLWGETEILIIDMPPGCGDEILDILRFIPRGEMVLVTTPAALSTAVTGRTAGLLKRMGRPLAGLVYNMSSGDKKRTGPEPDPLREITVLGDVPYSEDFESKIGNPRDLLRSLQAAGMKSVLEKLFRRVPL